MKKIQKAVGNWIALFIICSLISWLWMPLNFALMTGILGATMGVFDANLKR